MPRCLEKGDDQSRLIRTVLYDKYFSHDSDSVARVYTGVERGLVDPARSTMKTLTVNCSGGRLRGKTFDSGVYFGGIPFAKPPLGELRFSAPVAAEPWTGVRDATSPGPAAPQLAVGRLGPISRISRLVRGPMSEDCLTLNIWTPAVDRQKRPVLVWLHGGAFVLGAGSTFLYDSAALIARGDVVVVSINYRLGALGFLDLTALSTRPDAPSNLGLRDQIASLEWVRANIETFGGDPSNVTVFGESAGAMSIGALLAAAPALFDRAILESGACANVSSPNESAYVAERFLNTVGLAANDLEGLRSLSISTILEAQRSVLLAASARVGRLPWQPSIDGDLLSKPPLVTLKENRHGHRILLGTNRDEWKLFTSAAVALRGMSYAELERRIDRLLERTGRGGPNGKSAATAAALYRDITKRRGSRQTAYEAWVACRTDEYFRIPAIELAETLAEAGGTCFMYRFDYPVPAFRHALGACHAAEVPLVFGTQKKLWLAPIYLGSRRADRLSHVIQDAWLSFARSGDPEDAEAPVWPRYETVHRATRLFAADRAGEPVVEDPEADARVFWAS